MIASNLNVVLISHTIYDGDTGKYHLTGKGTFQKKGGFLSETDESIFIEVKGNKRTLHFRSGKFPARSLHPDVPDSMPVEDFNLQQHIELLKANADSVNEFVI